MSGIIKLILICLNYLALYSCYKLISDNCAHDVQYCNDSISLNYLTNIVLTAKRHNETLVSFTQSSNLLNEMYGKHFGFGHNLSQLPPRTDTEPRNICNHLSNTFIKTLLMTILGTSKRHLGLIIHNDICSTKVLDEIVNYLDSATKNTSSDSFKIHPLKINPIAPNIDNMQTFFYQMKATGVLLIVVLTDDVTFYHLFNSAVTYGLHLRHVTWLLPFFKHYEDMNYAPIEILTFERKWSAHEYNLTYVNGIVENDLPNITNSCHGSRRCIVENLYLQFVGFVAVESQIKIKLKYRNLDASTEWLSADALIEDKKFLLTKNTIPILKSINGFNTHKKIRAVTLLAKPFTLLHDENYNDILHSCSDGIICRINNGTSCCVGFLIDIFKEILKEVEMEVDMYVAPDNKYGALENGAWNGVVGELIKGHADIAIASLTITNDRSEVIDFTMPYTDESVGILVVPKVEELSIVNWKFVAPLEPELQIALWLITFVAVVLIFSFENNIYVTSISSKRQEKIKAKYYGIAECATYVASVFFQRDLGAKNPIRLGARVLSVTYAFGMVIFVTTYTAMLAAQSLQNIEVNPFKGSNDTRMKDPTLEFKYGTSKGSAYETLFNNTQSEKMKVMGRFMVENNLFYANLTDGMNKLDNGELQAIIGDYSSLKYWLSQDTSCERRLVKDNLFHFGLAFGVRKNIPWKVLVDQALLKLLDQEIVMTTEKKWFSPICQPQFFVTQQKELEAREFGGLTFLLVLTLFVSFVLLIPEFIYYKYFQNKLTDWLKSYFRRKAHSLSFRRR